MVKPIEQHRRRSAIERRGGYPGGVLKRPPKFIEGPAAGENPQPKSVATKSKRQPRETSKKTR